MKFIGILFILISFSSFSQDTSDPLYEKAAFAVRVQGETAYKTIVKFTDNLTSANRESSIREDLFSKEGVFHVEFNQDGNSMTILALSCITPETIKYLISKTTSSIDIQESEVYEF